MVREAAVAGMFYPSECGQIETMIAQFNSILNKALKDSDALQIMPRAIISPHAGYVYSGFTANIAHRVLGNAKPERIVVIGPSHRIYLQGMSGSFYDRFQTPCGDLEIDKVYLEHLASRFDIAFVPQAHQEHSTETQMPFIKHYNPQAEVVEIVYGDQDPVYLAKMCEAILADPSNAIVISTDLSHYYPLKTAEQLDMHCLKGVHDLDIQELHNGCEACGKIGVEAIVIAAKELGLKPRILDYRTSADASGDESQVVGYMSAAFI
ncbi:AmmeMemoRadiSam system protein B [Nitratiruptor sp. YY09-18]|uniref:AmmeMemoRadiSam system protein B n=1 Tax=Nitratiruptor sp. YY09-18 TaxID=2724901 RepID=UPI0019156382|nr:AmmeMemoRadiSam system protein B [Nitratiruptor sp. YY09-18]BCD67896.1 MEMO1 family protein [Nitratiruptor sp. YY09-18]